MSQTISLLALLGSYSFTLSPGHLLTSGPSPPEEGRKDHYQGNEGGEGEGGWEKGNANSRRISSAGHHRSQDGGHQGLSV